VSLSEQTRHPFSVLQVAGDPDRPSPPMNDPPTEVVPVGGTPTADDLQVTESKS